MFAGHNRGKYFMPGEGYVRGKKSVNIKSGKSSLLHVCAFCGWTNTLLFVITSEDKHKVCGGCGRIWFRKRNGDFIYVGYIGDGK